jgi:uncharacterized repeat protein (TIGR02543 family)
MPICAFRRIHHSAKGSIPKYIITQLKLSEKRRKQALKKNGTRLLSLLLVLTMVLSFAPTAFAAEPEVAAPAEEESYGSSWGDWEDWENTDPDAAPVEEEQPAEEPAVEPVEEPVAEEEPALVEEPVAEEEPVEVAYPANTFFYVGGSGLRVTVDAPEGAFPADAAMTVTEVRPDAVQGVVANAGVEGEVLIAADISFRDANGAELEPEVPVEVAVTASMPKAKDLKVVHIDDDNNVAEIEQLPEGAAVSAASVQTASDARTLRFEAKSFSVYAVVADGDQSANARVQVNFINGENTIATMYVKNGDTAEELEVILYDPGVGTVPEGQMFRGWTKNENYTAEDAENALTIQDIREEMEALTIKEGMPAVNYYAMIFKAYTVTYLDQNNVTLKAVAELGKASDTFKHTINEPYTPYHNDENFEGWIDTETGTIYENGTEITLTKNVTLKANVPKGNWLIFKENGEGASYTGPQFIHSGGKGTRPSDPTRVGYTFDNWYEAEDGSGSAFDFNNPITKRTVLYAKWNPVSEANYTVIIWKQNVDGNGYDFEEAITIRGTVGADVAVSQQGTGNDAYARIDGNNYRYTGFHLDNFTQNVKIKPEGNSVVNVYYNRTEYTLTFRANNRVVKTITALYQQNISSNFPIVGTDGTEYTTSRWKATTTTPFNQVLVFIDVMPAYNVTFDRNTANYSTKYLWLFEETLDGAQGQIEHNGKQFNLYKRIEANYNFFTEAEDYVNLVGFHKDNNFAPEGYRYFNDNEFSGRQNTIWRNSNAVHVLCYYIRDTYTINFMDGEYVTGRGAHIKNEKDTQIGTSDDIYYQADISSYNKDGENYKDDMTRSGFVFEGWYLDSSCTEPAVFDTMPQGGITVYAKWRQVEYRVFLHPNVPSSDESFDMGDQETSFRVSYGDQIANGHDIKAERDEYELVGWYKDEACTDVFNSDAFVANDTTVTTAYAKTEDTELDKYGNPTESGNKDAKENRFWITKKFDLYAKWRSKLIGAEGITVIYEAGDGKFADGTNTWEDPIKYKDAAQAAGAGAPTAPDGKIFKHWVVLDGSKGFAETETTVLPGALFTVLKSMTERTENADHTAADPSYTYTFKLKAVYGEEGDEPDTSITWSSNIQDVAGIAFDSSKFTKPSDASAYGAFGYSVVDNKGEDGDLKINEKVAIRPANTYAYPGYTFLGWAKLDVADDPDAQITTIDQIDPNNLFLKWVADSSEAGGHFESDGKTVTHVAADERNPHQHLVAVWQGEFYVYHSGVVGGAVETIKITSDLKDPETGKISYNLVKNGVSENTLYGGYYLEGNFSTPAVISESTPAYDGTSATWTWNKGEETPGNAIVPVAGTTYYIKEVPAAKFLRPYTHFTYYLNTSDIGSLFMISDIDDLRYQETGFIITDPEHPDAAKVYATLNIKAENTGDVAKLTPSTTFGKRGVIDDNFLTCLKVPKSVEGKVIQQYWVTPDGALVNGIATRMLTGVTNRTTIKATSGSVTSTITFG